MSNEPLVPNKTYRVTLRIWDHDESQRHSESLIDLDATLWLEPLIELKSDGTYTIELKPVPQEELRYAHEKARFEREALKYKKWMKSQQSQAFMGSVTADSITGGTINSDIAILGKGLSYSNPTVTPYEDRPGYIKSDQAPTAGDQFDVDGDNSNKHGNPEAELQGLEGMKKLYRELKADPNTPNSALISLKQAIEEEETK